MVDYAFVAREYFDASHQVEGYPGCGAPHGHTFKVTAVIQGGLERDDNGIWRTFSSELLQDNLRSFTKELDGRDLNAMMKGTTPTPELIAAWFLERLPAADWVEVEMGWRKVSGIAKRNKKL